MNFKKLTFIVFLFVGGYSATAQSLAIQTDTIRWTATHLTDKKTNATEANACQFVTYGTHKMEWIQNNGAFKLTWNIINTEGTWPDTNQQGSITLEIALEDQRGIMIISRTTLGVAIELRINETNISYKIAAYEKI
jgi:hypothetical protein